MDSRNNEQKLFDRNELTVFSIMQFCDQKISDIYGIKLQDAQARIQELNPNYYEDIKKMKVEIVNLENCKVKIFHAMEPRLSKDGLDATYRSHEVVMTECEKALLYANLQRKRIEDLFEYKSCSQLLIGKVTDEGAESLNETLKKLDEKEKELKSEMEGFLNEANSRTETIANYEKAMAINRYDWIVLGDDGAYIWGHLPEQTAFDTWRERVESDSICEEYEFDEISKDMLSVCLAVLESREIILLKIFSTSQFAEVEEAARKLISCGRY